MLSGTCTHPVVPQRAENSKGHNKMEGSVNKAIEKTLLDAAKVVEDQIDAEIDRLDKLDSDELTALREKRIQQMKKAETQKQDWLSKGHGKYKEVADEKEFFEECKDSDKVVCHFFRDTTWRCKIVDKHLVILAPKHLETKFIKINVERCPFLIERLRIKMLPTIGVIVDGKTKDYIRGFDDLGGHDEFPTEMLEWRLGVAGGINYTGNLLEPPSSNKPKQSSILGSTKGIRESSQKDVDSDTDED